MELVNVEPRPGPFFRVLDHLVPYVIDAYMETEILHAAPEVLYVVDHEPFFGLHVGPVGKRGKGAYCVVLQYRCHGPRFRFILPEQLIVEAVERRHRRFVASDPCPAFLQFVDMVDIRPVDGIAAPCDYRPRFRVDPTALAEHDLDHGDDILRLHPDRIRFPVIVNVHVQRVDIGLGSRREVDYLPVQRLCQLYVLTVGIDHVYLGVDVPKEGRDDLIFCHE